MGDRTISQDVLAVITFLGCVIGVFLYTTVILVKLGIGVVTKNQRTPSKIEYFVLFLGGAGLLCVMYGYFIEPYWLSVTTVKLSSNKIHSGDRSIRIVQISDLHCDPGPRLEEKLPTIIAALKPDIIAFTGDTINTPAGLPIFKKCMTQLAKIAPTYVVQGNWDAWYFKNLKRFDNTGVMELKDKPIKVKIANNDIWLAGLPVGTQQTVKGIMNNVPLEDYRIFLFHYPDCIQEMKQNNIDLYLAGHTHGGQVALPFYGALITLCSTGKRYESGLYREGQTYLYVNRGIGMEGGKAPRVRFLSRPEITLIEINGLPDKQLNP